MRLVPKLSAAMLVVAAGVTVAVASLATARQVDSMTAQYRSKGEAIALALAFSLSANTKQTLAGNVARVRELINASKTISGVSYIYIQDWEQSILAHTFEPTFPPSFTETNWVEKGALAPGEQVKVSQSVEIETPQGRIWAMDVAAPIAASELGVVHVGMDRASIEREVSSLRRSLLLVGAGVGAGGVLLGLLMAVFVFVRPLRRLTESATAIASRSDLTVPIEVRSRDEIGVLAGAFVKMVEGLRGINGGLQDSARILSNTVSELSSSAEEQERTVTRQAAALQQTQATAQEIKQISRAAALKAETVVQVAKKAESITRSGEAAIEQTMSVLGEMRNQVASMAAKISLVSERAAQIGQITDTVKDLADQSNMLALNAAIEAVRSGEHGKGFAVVAREIRTLADESIKATQRVRGVLDDVIHAIAAAVTIARQGEERMESGLAQAQSSGDNLRALSEIVKDSSSAAQDIAQAVSQQDVGINQLFSAVRDLSSMMEETVNRLGRTGEAATAVRQVSDKVSQLAGSYRV
jgi:methyl-accepting chemotaxis protein